MGDHQENSARFDACLAEHVYQAAWRYAWQLCRVAEDAEDLLQEALAHAWLSFPQLRDPARFKGWLLRIVRTRFLMRKRRGGIETTDSDPADWAGTKGQHPAADPYGGLPPELATAVLDLAPALREVVELFYLHSLSSVEIGAVLSIRPAAVKVRLHRARLVLSRALAPGGRLADVKRSE
ncbi:RNA polymerase sigma factor [bacterium]|nr:RNA polymerase sigma factor [bacterium]